MERSQSDIVEALVHREVMTQIRLKRALQLSRGICAHRIRPVLGAIIIVPHPLQMARETRSEVHIVIGFARGARFDLKGAALIDVASVPKQNLKLAGLFAVVVVNNDFDGCFEWAVFGGVIQQRRCNAFVRHQRIDLVDLSLVSVFGIGSLSFAEELPIA